jgi:hypothetical protein
MLLVCLWDEGECSPLVAVLYGSQEVARQPAHVAIAPLHCPKAVVVELKR